jgi:hypothetical protein
MGMLTPLLLTRRHPWSTYAVLQTTLTSWSLVYDILLAWLFWHISSELEEQPKQMARALVYLWVFLFCRLVKYLEHFVRYPGDLKYVLLIPLFGYFHASFIKLHAMFTLNVVSLSTKSSSSPFFLPQFYTASFLGVVAFKNAQFRPTLFIFHGFLAGT